VSMRLKDHPQVQKSLQNLIKMGLKVALEEISSDVVMLAIDTNSMVDYMKRAIASKMAVKKYLVEVDWESKLLIIWIWRGEMPKWLMARIPKT